MANYRFHADASVTLELRRIALDQVDKALDELEDDDRHEAVHQARKRCKKVRAVLRLVRGADEELYQHENAAFRDAARRVSDVRDATAVIEAYDLLADAYAEGFDADTFAPVRDGLVARRDDEVAGELDDGIAGVRDDLTSARDRIPAWELGVDGFEALAGGLGKTYGRCVKRMADAYDETSTEAFHEWRKRVKYHRYHVRLLQDCWPDVLKVRREALHDLTDHLGDDHDLAVLRDTLHAAPDDFGGVELVGAFTGLLDRRRTQYQLDARTLGQRCFAEPPPAFVARVGQYWAAWQAQPAQEPLLADAVVPAGA